VKENAMDQKPVTRIDLTAAQGGVLRKMWREGWKEGDRAEVDDLLPGRELLPLLIEAEKKGYSVTQFNNAEARLLRGEIVRVDALRTIDGLAVHLYPYGWTAKTRPIVQETRAVSFEEVIAGYEAQGWTVYRWEDGARAFSPGHLAPVRDAAAILQMRRRLDVSRTIDLAYQL
jgi:hypothetical protein